MQIEEAIADLKYYIGEDPYFNGTYDPVTDFEKYCYNNCKAIDTVLNELEKKDTVIDLMAEQLAGLAIFDIAKEEPLILGDKEEVKQYFYKKAEEK